jgi:WD40 repeat protein
MSAPKSKRRRSGASASSLSAALSGGGTATSRAGATEMEGRCSLCGGAGHSHSTCVLVGAALHRWMLQLGPGKDMTLVVDIILRLLMWGWREACFDDKITCLSYTKWGDVIAVSVLCESEGAVAGTEGNIFFMNAQTGEKILCPVTVDSWVNSVAFSPDGSIIAAANNYEIQLFDVQTQAKLGSPLTAEPCHVDSMAFSPDGSIIAAVYLMLRSKIQLFDAQTQTKLGSPLTVDDVVESVAFSPDADGSIIAVACGEKIQLFDAQTQAKLGSPLTGHQALVRCVAFSPDGLSIASCSGAEYDFEPQDNSVRLWDVKTGKELLQLSGHSR